MHVLCIIKMNAEFYHLKSDFFDVFPVESEFG